MLLLGPDKSENTDRRKFHGLLATGVFTAIVSPSDLFAGSQWVNIWIGHDGEEPLPGIIVPDGSNTVRYHTERELIPPVVFL